MEARLQDLAAYPSQIGVATSKGLGPLVSDDSRHIVVKTQRQARHEIANEGNIRVQIFASICMLLDLG